MLKYARMVRRSSRRGGIGGLVKEGGITGQRRKRSGAQWESRLSLSGV